MSTLKYAIGLLAVVTIAAPAQAQDKRDQHFLKEAVQGNLKEVEMGKIAGQRAKSDGVRAFGEMLVKDHSANNEKAKQLASGAGMTQAMDSTAKDKRTFQRFSKMPDAKFEREFVKHMIMDHKEDIREFEKGAKSKDPKVAAYAQETLPTLHKHLDAAQALQKQR